MMRGVTYAPTPVGNDPGWGRGSTADYHSTDYSDIHARDIDLLEEMSLGFQAYSSGRCVVPPVGELLLDQSQGEVHIKYGYVRGEEHYVIKVASGFPGNPALGLPVGDGLMLLFRQDNGALARVLRRRLGAGEKTGEARRTCTP